METTITIPPIFQPTIFKPIRYKVYYGGRGGGKSWAIARALIVLSLQKKIRILCTRELQKSIADSVHKLLTDQINTAKLDDAFRITRTNITSAIGSEFIFAGLHANVSEIKSMEGIDICWVEEAHKVSEDSWQVLIPTIRKEGSEIWISFNPDSPDDPTFKRFIERQIDNSVVVKTTFRDNPWFTDVLKRELEYDKRTDYQKYLHVWEGEPRVMSEAQVFYGKFETSVFDSPDETDVIYRYGADWGFSQDPTVLVRCFIRDNFLYVDYEAYAVGVDIDDTPTLFDQVPLSRKYKIIADSARPETIHYLKKKGYNIEGAYKGKGSVDDGIAKLRSFEKIIVHERCRNTINEFKMYSYKIDKLTNNILPILVDAHNHCFSGETLVITDKGEIPIKHIKAGNNVLTRSGYKKVLKVFDNGIKTTNKYIFANKKVLTATDTHYIITKSGKIRINKISDEKLYFARFVCGQWRIINTVNQRLSYLMALHLDAIQKVKKEIQESITQHLIIKTEKYQPGYMLRYGKSIMDMCRKVSMCIIKIIIHSIIISGISLLLKVKNIYQSIVKISQKNRREKEKRILTGYDRLQKNGMRAKKGTNGTRNILTRVFQNIIYFLKRQYENANNAVKNILLLLGIIDSVQISVNQHGDATKELTIYRKYAQSADESFQRINTMKREHVQGNAERVYDLMIDENHEYFANRVLVSNSIDSLRYSISDILWDADIFVGTA